MAHSSPLRRPARPACAGRPVPRLIAVACVVLLAVACSGAPSLPISFGPTPTPTEKQLKEATKVAAAATTDARKAAPTATPYPAIQDPANAIAPRSTVYVGAVQMPVGLTFAPDGRLFFSEAFDGAVRIAEPGDGVGQVRERPFVKMDIAKGPETGMLGIAMDPDFVHNHWVYIYYSEPDPKRKDRVPLRNRVVRFTERDGVGTDLTVILDNIGISREGRHNGGIMGFGPDGKLYVTVGNAQERAYPQDLSKLNGKVLRLNPDGSVPDDNPFPGSPVYAYGFRNPFGLTFQPGTGTVFVTENSGDHDDEVNRVVPGGNYGFPEFEGPGGDPRFIDPVWSSGTKTIGPTNLTFYTGDQIPQYKNDLFFCAVNTGTLMRLRLQAPDDKQVEAAEEVANNCHLGVTNGPDGALYYASIAQIFRLGR
ncbi:MAG: PQQ-dependent sugar dehydrogenase [Chloroflexi bacterium]|nr:PQQ-dependent sugar dehydrogenase [Chloroflexota bacterium]